MKHAEIKRQLASGDPAELSAAAAQLSLLAEEAAPLAVEIVRALAAADDETRELLTSTLEDLGPPPENAVKALTAMLIDPTSTAGSVYWSATLLGRLDGKAAAATDALARFADSTADLAARERCVWALAQIGPDAKNALPTLETLSKDESPRIARLAVEALQQIKQ